MIHAKLSSERDAFERHTVQPSEENNTIISLFPFYFRDVCFSFALL